MIELQTVTTKAKNPSTNEFQDVTWGGINVLSTSGTTNYNNLTNKPIINGVIVQGSLTTGDLLITAADVGALPSGTKYGADFALTIDSQTFVVTAQLKDQDGNNLGQAKTIDLPLETMVVSGSYDDTTQKIILTLKNEQTVEFSVADLVSGLQSEITLSNKLDADLVSDVSSENKFVTAAEKSAWNRKQEAISDLSTIRSGAAAGATALQQSDVSSTYSASGTAPVNGTAVAASQAAQDAEIAWNVNQGVKNLLNPTDYIANSRSGVIITYNGNGTYRLSGTPTQASDYLYTPDDIYTNLYGLQVGQAYTITTGVESSKVLIRIIPSYNGTSYDWDNPIVNNVSTEATFTIPSNVVGLLIDFRSRTSAGSLNGIVLKPMIRPAAITDPTFQPYALPNPVLTQEVNWNVNQGVKNLLWNHEVGYSETLHGRTFTVLSDGGIKITGTASDSTNADFYIIGSWRNRDVLLNESNEQLKMRLSCAGDYGYNEIRLRVMDRSTGSTVSESGIEVNKDRTFSHVVTTVFISVWTTVTLPSDGIIVYPMIRPAAITDPTFQPYALSNPVLTPAVIKAVDEGAKNLLRNTASSQVVGGVTFTVNADGTIIANGTKTNNDWFYLSVGNSLDADTYVLSSGLAPRSDSSIRLLIATADSLGSAIMSAEGERQVRIKQLTSDYTGLYYAIRISSGTTVNNIVFKPMLCTAADYAISTAFVPYRPSYDNFIDEVNQLKNYIGYEKSQILGLQVDYQNKTFTRLGKAADLTPSSDFNQFNIYNKRRRCNVSDDGTINAFYGESSYIEDGTNGQVMVYQPKFYYKVEPLKLEPIVDGEGYHIRKANYYISETPRNGFKLHPAFKDENGNELEYYLIGAYEASLYDASKSTYILDDAQVADFSADKICSIANAKPISGLTQNLTRSNCEKLAINRGTRWHNMTIQIASAEQLLFMIEYGKMNAQEAIGKGVVNKASGEGNESINTGATSNLGNASGAASGTDGLVSIVYRGVENLWGNIWNWIDGVNIWGDGTKKGGIPYITDKLSFVENTKTNYKSVGFTTSGTDGYISAMGYGNPDYDWVFFASEIIGNSTLPVGDYQYYTANLNGYRVARLGGAWADGLNAGLFYWRLADSSSDRDRPVGGRGVIIPDINATNYWTNIRKAS